LIFKPFLLEGSFLIEAEPRLDERGFFARGYCRDEMRRHGIDFEPIQGNISSSKRRGTLRGLHTQCAPHEEAKLFRCTRGAFFQVVVDIRSGSPTYGQWFGVEMSADSLRTLFVPGGCLNGYLTLEDETEAFYFVDAPYTPEAERGARWNDPLFGIEWPDVGELTISEKDRSWPDWDPSR
jgi:dTDP-4-dehydrorhamnose 3,5-epimerase